MKKIALALLGALTLGAGLSSAPSTAEAGYYRGYGYGYHRPVVVRRVAYRPVVYRPRPVVVYRPAFYRPYPFYARRVAFGPRFYRPYPFYTRRVVYRPGFYGRVAYGPRWGYGRFY